MNEQDVIYEYAQAELRAESMGLSLRATRVDFVLRDSTKMQEYARCGSLGEVGAALDRRAAELKAP